MITVSKPRLKPYLYSRDQSFNVLALLLFEKSTHMFFFLVLFCFVSAAELGL